MQYYNQFSREEKKNYVSCGIIYCYQFYIVNIKQK